VTRAALFAIASLTSISALLFSSVTPAHACSCAVPFPSPAEPPVVSFAKSATHIVVGTVTELRIDPPFDPNVTGVDYTVYTVTQTDEYLKGSGPATLNLVAIGLYVNEMGDIGPAGEFCQLFGFEQGDRRFVLFFDEQNPLERDPGYCAGSRVLVGEQGEQYLQEIRGILAATPTPSPSPAPTESPPTAAPSPIVAGLPQSGASDKDSGDQFSIPAVVGPSLCLLALIAASVFLFNTRRA
jgi:hypothetical protein